jgi:hypothetical protein
LAVVAAVPLSLCLQPDQEYVNLFQDGTIQDATHGKGKVKVKG